MDHNFSIKVLIKRITSALDDIQALLCCDLTDNERYFFDNIQSQLFLSLSKTLKPVQQIDKETLALLQANASELIEIIPARRVE